MIGGGIRQVLQILTYVLNENLSRVDNLISLYGPATPGRRKVKDTDVLRAAVVLLHAGLEDFLRGLMIWKIDTYSSATLDSYAIPNGTRRPPAKISLGDLASHKGKTVDELIVESVRAHLDEYQSFNDLGEVKKALKQCGIPADSVEAENFFGLPELIARRHNIVHKADRNSVAGGQGNHRTKSLGIGAVKAYLESVQSLRDFVVQHLN